MEREELRRVLEEAGFIGTGGAEPSIQRVVGELTQSVRSLDKSIEKLKELPPKVQTLQEWREREESRQRRWRAALWSMATAVGALFIDEVWSRIKGTR